MKRASKRLLNWALWISLLFATFTSIDAFGKGGSGGGIGNPLGMSSKPLEVKGQNRALSMMQVGRGDKTKIGFVQPRKNFRPEILSTRY